MNIVVMKSKINTIKQGDPKFTINDGMVTYPRAMLEITAECPTNIRNHIAWAYDKGYLKCVANVYGKEITMDTLRG